jgi:hypothetical protein
MSHLKSSIPLHLFFLLFKIIISPRACHPGTQPATLAAQLPTRAIPHNSSANPHTFPCRFGILTLFPTLQCIILRKSASPLHLERRPGGYNMAFWHPIPARYLLVQHGGSPLGPIRRFSFFEIRKRKKRDFHSRKSAAKQSTKQRDKKAIKQHHEQRKESPSQLLYLIAR